VKQIVQEIRTGITGVREIPDPIASPGQVVVASVASLVSAGTERMVVELARKSLLGKARERPDHVRRVLQKIKEEGLLETGRQVMAKLDEPMPLGYSSAGIVLECGAGVQEFKPGDRVASAGPHAGVVSVSRNLCARIPDEVSFEDAAYTSVASIALEGVRLARVTLGERVLVIGLGLIGQISVALLKAQGCRVFGTDVAEGRLELARRLGADAVGTGSAREAVRDFSGGQGVDAVIITAATSSNEPIEFAAEAARTRGRIVLVGVVGLDLPRPPFFAKELEFTVSSSLGPGRGDPLYEDMGRDYPFGHVRWTARRNMEAVLDLIAQGKLPVQALTSHRFPIDRGAEAYELITAGQEPFLGIVLEYGEPPLPPKRRISLRAAAPPAGQSLGISLIGAGNFARLVLLPRLQSAGGAQWRGLCTAKGLSAEHTGRAKGFAFATTDAREIWEDPGTHAVFIATRHDLHADLVLAGLRAGKHVFVEKPLCLSARDLASIAALIGEMGPRCPVLMVGFNRRFAPATAKVLSFLKGATPLSISYRFASAPLPADHWTQIEEVGGGRILGEACHAIDTCAALAGSPPVRVHAESVGATSGLPTTDDRVFILLRHEDGSISSVSYQAGGDRGGPTERFEVFGGGRTVTVEGWDRIELWRGGRVFRARGGKDKGHAAEIDAFLRACRTGGSWPIPWRHLEATTWASLMAVRSLREGRPLSRDDSPEADEG
jgi:predicted dehydrogenase/threonine dehydrogenase-like Zn-dependent dehydrogenase